VSSSKGNIGYTKVILITLGGGLLVILGFSAMAMSNPDTAASLPIHIFESTTTKSPIPSSPTATTIEKPTVTFTPFQPLPPTPTFTTTPTSTPTPVDTATPEPSPTRQEAPDEHSIKGVRGQNQAYSLDCEARSAVDLAGFFGLSIGEKDFLKKLPLSDDPNEGFVGNYWGPDGLIPPRSYGIYPPPVAKLLRAYDLNANEQKNLDFDALKLEIAAGKPVMVWVINNVLPGTPKEYTPSNGNTTIVAHFEHTVLVIGYTPKFVIIQDGSSRYQRTTEAFLASWGVLGNLAITVADPPIR
jgi:uncharacterized protein YvpB